VLFSGEVFGGPTEAATFCAASLGLSNVGSRDDITKQKSQDLDLGNYCLFLALLNTFLRHPEQKNVLIMSRNGGLLSDYPKVGKREGNVPSYSVDAGKLLGSG
jgi:hypothetical protein